MRTWVKMVGQKWNLIISWMPEWSLSCFYFKPFFCWEVYVMLIVKLKVKQNFLGPKCLLRVCLDTAENWKLKLKSEKYYSKIIFKCVNSIVGPIFNEKIAEKWNLWIREQCTMCTDWLKRVRKVKLCKYCLCTVHEQ